MRRCISCMMKLLPALTLLLYASNAFAQVKFISAVKTVADPGTSLTLTVPAVAQTGDLLLALISMRGGSKQAITPPAGWALERRDDIGDFSQAVYWRVAQVTDLGSAFSWSGWSSNRAVAAMLVYRGADGLNPIDVSGGQSSASGKLITTSSVVATSTDPLLVQAFGIAAAGSHTTVPGGGLSRRVEGLEAGAGSNGLTVDIVDKPMSGAGAISAFNGNTNKAAGNTGQIIVIRPGAFGIDHYHVANNATGVNCQPETITITAHDPVHVPVSAAARSISISANRVAGAAGTHGNFLLLSGSGAFDNAIADDGVATYVFGTGESQVVLSYRNTWVQTVNISILDGIASDVSGAANADPGYDQDLSFLPSGFRFTDAIGNRIPDQVAGVSAGSYYLQAIQTGAGSCSGPGPCPGVCTVPAAFADGATVSVDLAFRCADPVTCQPAQQVGISNNGTSLIAANPAGGVITWSGKALLFGANGRAAFDLVYPDAGAISLHARYNIPQEDGSPSGSLMVGASNSFVVRPYSFVIATTTPNEINRSRDGVVNPGAVDANGPVFIRAGEDFSVTVTAVNLAGVATPNFGQELAPESVRLTSNLVAGLGLIHDPGLTNPASFGPFAAGRATGTTFSWSEVGIITLTPSVADGSYLGAGDVSGTVSGNVGRFVPFDFAVTRNVPLFDSGCSPAGKDAFTYIGEPFVYQTAPVITVTARNLEGATTLNYSGDFFRITQASLSGKSYTLATGSLDVSGIPLNDPAIRFNDDGIAAPPPPPAGVGTLTFTAGRGLRFVRNVPIVAFDADISLALGVVDADGTTVALIDGIATGNPVRFGQATAGNGILFAGTTVTAGKTPREMRFGRLRIDNSSGVHRLALPLRVRAEYYTSNGFVSNGDDSCTTFSGSDNAMVFVAGSKLTTCDTAVAPSGVVSLVEGEVAGLQLAAPGVGKEGSVELRINLAAAGGQTCTSVGAAPTPATFTSLDYLQGNWGGAAAWDQDPAARARFGINRNSPGLLHLEENY